ncbi:hypothetical protein ABFV05_020128 [Capra hircus]
MIQHSQLTDETGGLLNHTQNSSRDSFLFPESRYLISCQNESFRADKRADHPHLCVFRLFRTKSNDCTMLDRLVHGHGSSAPKGGRGHRVATPPEPAFSRAAAGGSPPAAQLASQRARGSGPALHSAPPPPRRSPSFGCSQRRSAPSAPPPRTPAPGSCLSAPGSALRLGEAASQENPRNLCKKLTMKFKKFFDFGAIFEWIERQPRTFISINPKNVRAFPRSTGSPGQLWNRTGPLEPEGGLAAASSHPTGGTCPRPPAPSSETQEHCINTLGPDLDTEDFCFKKIQSSLKSCLGAAHLHSNTTDLSSLTRDGTCTPCIGSVES